MITQNIDNLHQASGFGADAVIELHGNTTYAACLECARRHELAFVRQCFEASGDAPNCLDCGGLLKTATVSFGQPMPVQALQRAEELAAASDLFVVIGSSLVVWPAAGLPLRAKREGARLVIINREPTDFDALADVVIRADIGTALQRFIVI